MSTKPVKDTLQKWSYQGQTGGERGQRERGGSQEESSLSWPPLAKPIPVQDPRTYSNCL